MDLNDLQRIPNGLQLKRNLISSEQHDRLLSQVDAQPWRTDLKRRVQHYGWRYDYRARSVARDDYIGQLPNWLSSIAHKLKADGFFATIPDQAIVNEYLPGQGISSHVDCEPCFGDSVASLSLGSRCVMNFEQVSDSTRFQALLEPCSMIIISGEARFGWKHGIAARKSDVIGGIRHKRKRRVSITFRTVNSGR
ncbi:alpha-ketoglutarate-dependent dioxygenase AlkB [Pseudahrensia aquimaris]|uniref:Alpha-ketoglutarate-dependent dioxygenase AlkB n=1 Tax=Pseudahrensia aquimaris TaxID=744461 RepID=A0ABW3FLD4_9HYPH